MRFIIGVFDEAKLNIGTVTWKGTAFEDIKLSFGNLLSGEILPAKGIAYFSSSVHNSRNAYEIDVHNFNFSGDSLTANYSVTGILDVSSKDIRNKAQRYLRSKKIIANNKYIPYLSIIEEESFQKLLRPNSFVDEIKLLTEKHNWLEILNQFGNLEDIKNNPEVWNDEQVLSGISFATAKLSETYINLRHQFKNDIDKDRFLKQQKCYRELTETLRLRCIELGPSNPTYFSNLAYTYYQYVRELTQPGGRRDGNPKAEAEKALIYLNKALELNPNRTNDNYRKGQLLTEMLPKMLLFSKKSIINKELALEVNSKIKEGIQAFENVISFHKGIPENDILQKNKTLKDYIKCNYDVARSYSDLIIHDWDEFVFLLGLDVNIDANDNATYIPEDLINIEKAISCLIETVISDNPNHKLTGELQQIIDAASHNGILEGTYKLYSLGKYYFQKYWILSCYGQKPNHEADLARNQAEYFLIAALNFPWSAEKQKSDKGYIAERLCRLYISKKEYKKAINILLPFTKRRTDYYLRYSIAEAYMLQGMYDDARAQINQALEDTKGNKELWLGKFLDSIALLRAGNIKESKIELNKAILDAEKEGKTNLDSLLITQGYIAIKEGKKAEAMELFKSSLEINPYRVSVQKRVPGWGNYG
jgi:predicted negative regulator of RcsB-dependent stress response